MAKQKQQYICSLCSHTSTKWFGSCPSCKEWNTFTEHRTESWQQNSFKQPSIGRVLEPTQLSAVPYQAQRRLCTQLKEWDRVTGGGIVPGSFMILTGDPGIGKSTLLLHIADRLSQNHTVLYISTEESLEQVKGRATRINCADSSVLFSDNANLDDIITTAQHTKPDIIIIDSIQNCYTTALNLVPGSVGHLKEAAFRLMRMAKENTIAILISGHITKEGIMAGPKTLEHMVDAVFYLQGEDRWQTRVLRAVKNRFGTVNEIGFFEMASSGLQEITNINQQLLETLSHSPGSALTSSLEGSRPLLLELQALTIASKYGMPQRVIAGTDHTQVVLLIAILEKYLQIPLSTHDLFFKISGGFKIKESSADLAIALGILSSFFQKSLPRKTVILGEINLTGHVKPINQINLHINEAEKFGIEQLFIPYHQKIENQFCTIQRFKSVYELLALF